MQHVINMKKLSLYSLLLFLLGSCDPPKNRYSAQGVTTIKATIVNPRDSIGINDTIRVQLEATDSLLFNGSIVHVTYGNNDGANCNLIIRKIDRSYPGSIGPATGSITFATIGYLNPEKSIFFQNNGNNLKAEYLFIPKSKGVFFIDQQTLGSLGANNGQFLLDFDWNYGNINRNHQMLIDSAGPGSNFSLFLQDRLNNAFEVYGFKIN